jgi:TPR repeat protein
MKYSDLISMFVSTAVSLAVGMSCAVAAPQATRTPPTEDNLQRGMDLYEKGKYKDALDLWIPLAARGVDQAQYYVAVAYSNGTGLPKNSVRAAEWLARAADKGLPMAEVALGLSYVNGAGVAIDKSRAVAWYRKAADQGDAAGQFHLGLMYADGLGVPKDTAEAVVWYRKSSAQGNALGQFLLAGAFWSGEGVEKDSDQALELYQKSANQGYEPAKVMGDTVALLKRGVATASRGVPSASFPPTPVTRQGVTSCNTRCNNNRCLRTYDDGRHVEFQAEHKFNALTNEWEWDSGTC